MKLKAFFMLWVMLFVVSCSFPTPPPAPTSTATPLPVCKSNVCVKDTYLELDGNDLFIHFDLTDKDFKVSAGEDIEFQSSVIFALFLVEDDESETYLFGADAKASSFLCYTGNDLPWTDGHLGATCGIILPSSSLQVRINEGDVIRAEIKNYDFSKDAIWLYE